MSEPPTLLESIDLVWGKFRAFMLESLHTMKVPEQKLAELREVTKHNSLAYLPSIRDFVNKNKEQILAREKVYFRALVPDEWKHLEIPDKILDKGLDYGKVFIKLVEQLEKE